MGPVIPRALVARALFVPEDSLPEADLPMERFAQRHRVFLSDAARDIAEPPEVWTSDVMFLLTREEPTLALAAIRATLALCETPGEVGLLAAGCLEDLLAEHGPSVIRPLAEDADARMLYALTGVWRNAIPPMVWAQVEALRAGVPGLDVGAPLPP